MLHKVQKVDGSFETVDLQFPCAMIAELEAAAENEQRIIELCCDRPRGWFKTLTVASKLQLLSLSIRVQVEWTCRYQAFNLRRLANVPLVLKDPLKHFGEG